MSITSGFYDSLNGDRRYTAKEMSAMFDGIINDGVLANIGDAFAVKAGTDNTVTVGTGRAWFNSTWVFNDALLSLTVPDSTLDQTSDQRVIDVVVLEVDRSEAIRAASVKMVGPKVYGSSFTVEEAVNGAVNDLTTNFNATSPDVQRYPLAAICRNGGNSDAIAQSNIHNYIGTSHCPFVTGILQVQSIDNIVARWKSEFETWLASVKDLLSETDAFFLQTTVNGIINGDTGCIPAKAYDADKLGGRGPGDYVRREEYDPNTMLAGVLASITAANVRAGTFPEFVSAAPNASGEHVFPQLRNISADTQDMVAGESTLPTGEIYFVYE